MSRKVQVVIGVGGMGLAIARRIAAGAHLVLADYSRQAVDTAVAEVGPVADGVTGLTVDVSDPESVLAVAAAAAELGPVTALAHTAGLSPEQASVEQILAVDLFGVACVIEEFGRIIAPGGAGLVIASMAGQMYPPLAPERTAELIATPADKLLDLDWVRPENFPNPGAAYGFAKHVNGIQVRAASVAWSARQARINAISPGVIATPMGQSELDGENGAMIRGFIEASNARRPGTADDIAAAAEFLLGPSASFISGSDLLVDGGVVAALRSGHRR
jgi:NAD(P)-dependent dehydrogenase (short-subunit alcohol dehydrogenase family)